MRRRPPMIELVGPAGVGKTTLAQHLEAAGLAVRGTMWHVPTPDLARGTLKQCATAFSLYRDTGRFLWSEVKHLARLDALYASVRALPVNGPRLVVLDEGPVYTFGWLQVIGHPRFSTFPPPPFWYDTLERWSRCLDAIVVLDAPDHVLANRIQTREKPHPLKNSSVAEITAFVNAYRQATTRVLLDLQAVGSPAVLRLKVGEDGEPADERLRDALEQTVYAR